MKGRFCGKGHLIQEPGLENRIGLMVFTRAWFEYE